MDQVSNGVHLSLYLTWTIPIPVLDITNFQRSFDVFKLIWTGSKSVLIHVRPKFIEQFF